MSDAPGGAAPTAPAPGGAAPGAGAMCPCGGCGVSWSFFNEVVWRFLKVQVGLTPKKRFENKRRHGVLKKNDVYMFCFLLNDVIS